ncbi:MAG: NimC/NimA family protein [Bacilli bacterium]|nr:NimC/NimA family protein [Bacilli bacterium]
MNETFNFLKENTKVNYVATLNGDRPSCRPFGDPILFNNKIYILTNKEKNVSKQIAINNHVCIVAYDNNNWIRINCVLIDDSSNVEAKKAIIKEFDWAEEAGYTLDNPNFQVLYISDASSMIYDVDGNVIQEFNF